MINKICSTDTFEKKRIRIGVYTYTDTCDYI